MLSYSPHQINCTVLISIISPPLTSKNQKPLEEIEAFEKSNQSRPNRAKLVEVFRSKLRNVSFQWNRLRLLASSRIYEKTLIQSVWTSIVEGFTNTQFGKSLTKAISTQSKTMIQSPSYWFPRSPHGFLFTLLPPLNVSLAGRCSFGSFFTKPLKGWSGFLWFPPAFSGF